MDREQPFPLDFNPLFDECAPQLPDFWSRRSAQPSVKALFAVFGRPVHLSSNDDRLPIIMATALSAFSKAPAVACEPFAIQVVVQSPRQPVGSPPHDLITQITYSGSAEWLMWHLGSWGHVHVDLARRQAHVVIAPSLVAQPKLVISCVLHTILLNFCIADGCGMLHASCLVKEDAVLLMMAPHNTGKSTTALRLIMNGGYRLLSDSMVFVLPESGLLAGFPAGRIKLRADMVPTFPRLAGLLAAEPVRDEVKYAVDLRRLDASLVVDEAVSAEQVTLLLLSREKEQAAATVEKVSAEVMQQAVVQNSLYFDSPQIWRANLGVLAPVLSRARCFRLHMGHDLSALMSVI